MSYAGHRHSVGHVVAEELAGRLGGALRRHRSVQADVCEGRLGPGGRSLVVAIGRTYMNTSGGPVAALAGYYKIAPTRLVVVHDELDLPFEGMRLKFGGGDNGHNGLKSIRRALGTGDFYRVRVGVGRPPGNRSPSDHVLSPYTPAEKKHLPLQVARAVDAVEALVSEGLSAAQQAFNS